MSESYILIQFDSVPLELGWDTDEPSSTRLNFSLYLFRVLGYCIGLASVGLLVQRIGGRGTVGGARESLRAAAGLVRDGVAFSISPFTRIRSASAVTGAGNQEALLSLQSQQQLSRLAVVVNDSVTRSSGGSSSIHYEETMAAALAVARESTAGVSGDKAAQTRANALHRAASSGDEQSVVSGAS